MNIVDRLIVRTIKTLALIPNFDAGQQTKELKPGKKKKLLEKKLRKESKEREERGLEICKVCKFFINHQKSLNI
jgi:hypothetical protein